VENLFHLTAEPIQTDCPSIALLATPPQPAGGGNSVADSGRPAAQDSSQLLRLLCPQVHAPLPEGTTSELLQVCGGAAWPVSEMHTKQLRRQRETLVDRRQRATLIAHWAALCRPSEDRAAADGSYVALLGWGSSVGWQVLESPPELSQLAVGAYPLQFFPLEDDAVSLELDSAFKASQTPCSTRLAQPCPAWSRRSAPATSHCMVEPRWAEGRPQRPSAHA